MTRLRITIEKLVHGGSGLGEVSGKRIFVPYSAPGDELEVSITADHGTWAEAEIESIVHPAPCRVSPPCPVFGRCGGCQWQHISYEAQLEWKRLILIETLERIGKITDPPVLETLASPKQWYYRNRIQLHGDSRGHVGFYGPRSKEVVEFGECIIADEHINQELAARREELSKRTKGIALRAGGGEGFSQVNPTQNEQMKELLCQWLKEVPHRTVLELYAGAGNLTFAVAKIAERVVASDIDGRAIRLARQRQDKGEGPNIEFVRAAGAQAARRFTEGCDAVVVDPPRTGCADVIAAIVSVRPQNIFYISCDPATLARDVHSFSERGYNLVRALPIDMFPQTYHVESLAMLELK
jgi:23S rRNA (uracil1939-C5)-methyltransferase